ncbi:hypothetical protein FSP39_021759 [Pinctada imbricata]|uniref:Chitin-binding type-2 domain-containing protein n=1 Tax=Pinctada imbricata TaxID=66713 RepID=A0AA89CBG6_PINIB|nr:hypothetical protein FSP39_021759 [Pinctada imbricata]
MTRDDCIPGMARAAHKDNCAQYFDCISKRSGGKTDQEPLLMECPYPLMFDEDSSSCQFPKKVKCGNKWTPTDPCEYSQNQCRSAQCVPCNLRFPTCKGLPDGLHPWTGKEWTPNYIVCEHERVMYSGMCELDMKGKRKLFNPDQKSCMERIIIQFQP